MAKSEHVGFRANIVEDKDILDDLKRFADKTGRLKAVYRKVMEMEAMAFHTGPTAADFDALRKKFSEEDPNQPPTSMEDLARQMNTTKRVDLPKRIKTNDEPTTIHWKLPANDTEEQPIDWRKNFPGEKNTHTEESSNTMNSNAQAVKKNILHSFD